MWKNETVREDEPQQLNFFDLQNEEQVTLSPEEQEVLANLNDGRST